MRIYVLVEDYSGYESPFLAQHGVSFLIEKAGKGILFDTGQSAEPILHNMKLLGLDPSSHVDYIFLSHCHYDHTGGLLGILKAIGRRVPVIAHPSIFRRHFVMKPYLRDVGIPFRREEVEELADLYLAPKPLEIIEGIYSTGEVCNRENFEQGHIGVYTLRDGQIMEDTIMDDMSLVAKTSEGLVIVSGCSHAGIVSIVKGAIRLTGERRVRAVIGGFHLIDASDERIERTVREFKELGVEEVYTGHCTGLRAEAAFLEAYGERFHKLHSGMVMEF
ncbi:MBL fold metallo-hydrolase [Thermococcus aciditolerans]|uniref:MBL fold metallo-hydrolase n=1 Tax=Thermococcus aciditolerans TaxID=2598455 RepID=A0A5C0SK53_9EURY|nr:MBL fold metallo-hydrolase [Thermococcus aciditolerans]QEK14107.1 MBL fold metallo-hydrolase [Thermococcus aciditolerans]